jgi:hypothetical protein
MAARPVRSKSFVMVSLGVMAGLVPAIHVFFLVKVLKTWMPGTRPGMTTFL